MKALTTFETLTTLTCSGENANYPDDNVKDLDPMKRWWADAYAADCWLKVNFGAAKALTALFLNRANFPAATLQGNATDAWGAPSFSLSLALVQDDAGNRKGWFDLTAFNYQWLRLVVPAGQTLDSSDTVPKLGNLIVGASVELPLVADLNPVLLQRKQTFETDAGGYQETNRGRARHVINMGIGDTLANLRAMGKTWTIAVVFADLANAGEAWLVYPPDNWDRPIRSVVDAQLRFALKERS